MILIALTGGIGSGKSTVAAHLAERGAIVLDADAMVREMQRPGEPVFTAMVERWGDRIVQPSGELDRSAVADIVFNHPDELSALEALIHPLVRSEMTQRITDLSTTEHVVIQDVPLLEKVMGARRSARVVVVDCPPEVAVDRLVRLRGFDRSDAEARIGAQISRAERRAMADFVVDNGGDLEDLDREIDRCWHWIATLEPTDWDEATSRR